MSNIGKRQAHNGKKPGKLSPQQIVLIVIVILLALALICTLAVKSLFVRPDLSKKNDIQKTVDIDGDGEPDEPEEIDWGDGIRPRGGDGERKSEDYWTVLILGRDTGGGGNTDTILLASYDVTNQKATVMSIPRDTMVNVPWDIKRINSVYNYYGGGQKGIQHLYKEISQLVGFEPDYQVVVEWEAVGEIVNAMGGVNFDVPRNMNYDDPYQNLHIHQTKGYRLLSGEDAMQVLRYRHDNNGKAGYADGDLGRIKTQQAFLKAMVQQLLQVQNVSKINQFIDVFKRNVETDMSVQNILWFAKQAVFGGLKMEDVNFVTMPNTGKYAYSRTVGNNQSYVVPNPKELLNLVNNELSPFTEVFTMRDLDIMSVNSDGSISSSTGYVEDKKAAVPPVKKDPEPKEEEPDPNEEDPNAADPGTDAGEPGEPDVSNPDNNAGTSTPTVIDPNPPETTDPGAAPPDSQEPPVDSQPQEPQAPSEPNSEPNAEPAPSEDPGFVIIGGDSNT